MRLPRELEELAQSTDVRFRPKWEFGRITNVFLVLLGRCYESRYKGHAIRYYRDSYLRAEGNLNWIYVEKRLKLFHSRPLNLGLQCYFNVSQISSLRLWGSEWRNLFASKLRTSLSDVRCYAAETSAAQALLSRSKTTEAFAKLMDLAERFVLQDEGVMIFFSREPHQRMLDTLHQLSTVLSESTLLPSERTHWTVNLGYLLGSLAFLSVLTVMMIVMSRSGS